MSSVDRLYTEEIGGLVIDAHGRQSESLPKKPLVLAGSFNPIHQGHQDLLSAAMAMTDADGYYEISIRNVDKPLLTKTELGKRSEEVLKDGKSFTRKFGELGVSAKFKKLKLKVQIKIQGEELRAEGKKRDDLQEAISKIQIIDIGLPIEFVNFRD